jgi:hypothetical protein
MLEADVDLGGDFVDFRVFLEQFDEGFDSLGEVDFAVVVDGRVRVAFDTDVVPGTVLEQRVFGVELFGVRVYLDPDSVCKLLLLADYLDKLPYFRLNCASPRDEVFDVMPHH